MDNHYFTKDNVQFQVEAVDWQDAIRVGVSILEYNGYVNQLYADEVIKNVLEYGPYIVIAPGIAIPHTRPENGALSVGMSLITLKHPIQFQQEEPPVKVMISFSATDSNEHLEIIKTIVKIAEKGLVDDIWSIHNVDQLNELIGEGSQ
ncbi:PTS sugar transporter subunit IIA [Robertmurraya sp.]|jgi:ascorbate PTS system EIIA or EIIAB component|uniref:PTS sugar transporter subunit IIA n=1 Tax=Robertmurraya sp. TaxID=2837525 RepID=UPI003703BA50